MKRIHQRASIGRRQRGVVLVIALILMLVMSLLALAGVRGTGMQERIAGNLRDRNLAFQSTEAALRAAELALADGQSSGGVPTSLPGDLSFWEACWQTGGTSCPDVVVHDVDTNDWGIAAQPQYRIERLQAGNYGSLAADEALASPPLYRITARGVGGSTDSVVLLQSTFRP